MNVPSRSFPPHQFWIFASAVLTFSCGGEAFVAFDDEFGADEQALVGAPDAPASLLGTLTGSTTIHLAWADRSFNETGFIVQRFDDQRGSFKTIQWLAPGTTEYRDPARTPGATYRYRVAAANNGALSAFSNVVAINVSRPDAPTELIAPALSRNTIQLRWKDNSNNETGFRVERAIDAVDVFQLFAELPPNARSYIDHTVAPGQTYRYRVQAQNALGASPYSRIRTTTTVPLLGSPQEPGNLRVTGVGSSGIAFAWADQSTDETEFVLEQATSIFGPFAAVQTIAANATALIHGGLALGTTYAFRLHSQNSIGPSGYTPTITVHNSAPVVAPTGLLAWASGPTQVSVTWVDTTDNEEGFYLERAPAGSSAYARIATLGANIETAQDDVVSAAAKYSYRVQAFNGWGRSAYSNSHTVVLPVGTAPTAPTNLSGGRLYRLETSGIWLQWQDNSTDEARFLVERATSRSGPFRILSTIPPNTTEYQDEQVASGVRYFYRVRAENDLARSACSNVLHSLYAEPLPLTDLRATISSDTSVALTWNDVNDNESSHVIMARLFRPGTDELSEWQTVANATSFTADALTPGTTYYFFVYADNPLHDRLSIDYREWLRVIMPGAPPAKKVFLTSGSYTGNLGGVTGADLICQQTGQSAGLSGSFKAWLSSRSSSPALRFTRASDPYQLLSGEVIANNWADLIDSAIATPIATNEMGWPTPPTEEAWGSRPKVWSATTSAGEVDGVPTNLDLTDDCAEWTSSSATVYGGQGDSAESDSHWTDRGFSINWNSSACNTPAHLYCFEQ